MGVNIVKLTESWAEPSGPLSHIVVSSRVRHARNLERIPFPPRAGKDDLRRVCESVDRLVRGDAALGGFERIDIEACSGVERAYLKESHVISAEMEQPAEHRVLYLDQARNCAVMVNEEDHLRLYCQRSGFQLDPLLEEINAIDRLFSQSLSYAFSERFGYLTTCPSNVGTGMRASVMLHLPGLVMSRQIEEVLKGIPDSGLTVRGYYGENSEFLGDFYQISNEVTLGKTEIDILGLLRGTVEQVIRKETDAREYLFAKKRIYAEDVIWRAYGTLTNARIVASNEAFKLLSPVRLGIERGYFPTMTHHQLNRLIVAVQPAHLQLREGRPISTDERDMARAQFLRQAFSSLDVQN